MATRQVKVQMQRLPSLISAILFGGVAGLFLDAAALGHIEIPLNSAVLWAIFGLAAFVTLVCLKTVVCPSIILAADKTGVSIGRGIIINHLQRVPWSKLNSVEEGVIVVTHKSSQSGHVRRHEYPALKLVFDESVDLGRSGYKMAHPEDRTTFLVSSTILSQPLEELIAKMSELQERYTQ